MENQGFEEEHQPQRDEEFPQNSQAFAFEQSGHELFPDDSLSILNADGHVYEDILPGVEDASRSTALSNADPRESNANSPRKPLDVVDYISRDSTRQSFEREDIAGAFKRNLTLPFRRGVGLEPSNTSSSVRLTNRKRNNHCREDAEAWNAGVFIDGGFSSQAQSTQAECKPNRRRRKKDCKHCRIKAAQACCSQEHQVDDRGNDTILRKNRNNEQQQRLHAMDPNSSDPQMILDTRNFAMVPLRSPIRETDELAITGNNSSSIFTISEKIDELCSPANTMKLIESEQNEGRANLPNSTDVSEDRVLTVSEKSRASMRVNSIYSQDRWYTKEAPIFLADVKEHGSFQRAYSLPARTQTPSSQNRINLRRSVRGEPPPHPARLRKHRHGWTLHLAHPLEASGCTRSLILLLIAVLVLLGIGAVALYIALEPEKLHIIQQYLRSSTNSSSVNDNVLAVETLLHDEQQNDSSTVSSAAMSSSTLAASMLLNSDQSFPESEAPLAPESETEATSLSSINSTRYCDDCRSEEVCVALVDEQVPTCRLPLDTEDPTGCAGFCLINKQKCHRLDIDAFRCVTIEHYCLDDEWTCLNTLCIPLEKHCDGHMNCYDHSDEYNCVCDLETHFQCGNETSCLPMEKRCDGKIDCWDAADEINCTLGRNLACPSENEFTCSDGQCILKARFCDGLPDCLDGSDEPHGCQGRCNKHEFTCQNSRCITKGMKCNGVDDCGDGTDERHCKDRFS
ncbi:unnamed protein product [Xylocopa violacea]|uniref:Low-density lipoprotein receptor-related protein 2 n=1 Tax=Xylocopa violacea TaxID=135666 RepID=A0ABP1NIX1_XYLVO